MGCSRDTGTPHRLAHIPRVWPLAAAILLFVATAVSAVHGRAQNSPAGGQASASQSGLPAGTTIYAALDKTINAKNAKAGDAVVARVTFPVLLHGKIFIENGTRIIGHVTQAKDRSRVSATSELGIVFDHVALKSGEHLPLDLTVQAIGFEPITPQLEQPQSDGEQGPFPPNPATSTNATRHSTTPLPSRPQLGDGPNADRPGGESSHPALDAGSKGMVNLPGLTLTEGAEAKQASLVSSNSKNVKLERGYSLVLRVIAAATPAHDQQQ